MNEAERAALTQITLLIEEFCNRPANDSYQLLLKRLRHLLRAMKTRGFDGIEYTTLKFVYESLEGNVRELAAALRADGPEDGAEAVAEKCTYANGWLRRLLIPVAPETAIPDAPEEGVRGWPFATVLLRGCVVAGRKFHFTDDPSAEFAVVPLIPCLLSLRELGVTYLGFSGASGMSAEQLTWLCSVARKVWDTFDDHHELCGGIEIVTAQRTLHASIVFTKKRAVEGRERTFTDKALWIGLADPHVLPTVPTGVSKDSVIAALTRDYRLKAVAETAGAAWTVAELLDVQEAFAKIPVADRAGLAGCLLLRDKAAGHVTRSQHKVAACYDPDLHRLTVFDLTFAGAKGFAGQGRDTSPYSQTAILHEVGHVVEELYGPTPKRLPRPPRGSGEMAAASAPVRWEQVGCVGHFVALAEGLGVQPFTLYAWSEWPDNPSEFWAEAYRVFLTDPAALEFIAPDMLTWFRRGMYRVDSRTQAPVAAPDIGLTPDQTAALTGIRDQLDALAVSFGSTKEASPDTVERLRKRFLELSTALDRLCSQVRGQAYAKIERTILERVARMLAEGVGVPLGPLDPPGSHTLPAVTVFPSLQNACAEERFALTELLKPAPSPPEGTGSRTAARRCTIALGPAGKSVVLVGDEAGGGFEVVGLTRSMALLRGLGFRSIALRNCGNLSALELTWVCNAARRLFVDCGEAFGLSVSTSVLVPAQRQTYLVRVTFSKSRRLRIRFDGIRPHVAAASPAALPTVDQCVRRLASDFGVKSAVGINGGVWTADELVQVCDALDKVPREDRRVLVGCSVVRKGAASVPPGPPGKRRDGSRYLPGGHSLVLRDDVFAGVGHSYVGSSGATGPFSHAIVLRLVGQAVALRKTAAVGLAAVDPGGTDTEPECLASFRQLVAKLGVPPIGEYAAEFWPAEPSDFFAEAYALSRHDPDVLEWISPALRQWFERGGYRTWSD